MEELRNFVLKRRDELGLSQRALASASGLDAGTIAGIEVGRVTKSPRGDTLAKLAKGLRVDVDVLHRIVSGEAPKPSASVPQGEWFKVVQGTRKRYEPTEDELRVIEQMDRIGVWNSEFTNPAFWELTPEEREGDFFYLKGLIKEHQRRHGKVNGK